MKLSFVVLSALAVLTAAQFGGKGKGKGKGKMGGGKGMGKGKMGGGKGGGFSPPAPADPAPADPAPADPAPEAEAGTSPYIHIGRIITNL